jgi:formylglycine-generating enzyme required for sulfatase activity
MKSKDIRKLFDELAECIQIGDTHGAYVRSCTLFTILLSTAYARVRGQASPGVMRDLLGLEIEIGGEDGDFRAFGSDQLVDLFIRGRVAAHLRPGADAAGALSTAVDLRHMARWFDNASAAREAPSPASVRLVQAWLNLFAEEAGILDPGERGRSAATRPELSGSPPKADSTLPQKGRPYTEPITGMAFVFVPGGTFSMGDTFDDGAEDEKPVHEVRLTEFYMAACPVTQAQWASLMDENPSGLVAADHPVEQVTLTDVRGFIDKLNAATPEAVHFDLPTEAQWEYAARSGGKNERYGGGEDPDSVAWFEDNHTGGTAAVGRKAPNGLGLYDMSGNVWEWCRDLYHAEAYRQHAKRDPVCTRGDTDRVIRGGSWHLDAWSARCSRRFRFDPELFGPALGFRLVMVLGGAVDG